MKENLPYSPAEVLNNARRTTLGLAVLAVFSATPVYAEALIDGNHVLDENRTIAIELVSSPESNEFSGIYAQSTDQTMKVTVAPGSLLTINGSGDASSGKIVRAVNVATGASLEFNGDLKIDVSNNQASARSFWIAGDATFTGNVHAVAKATEKQLAEALTLRGASHTLTINGDETYLRAESDGGRVLGVENFQTSGGVINFNADHTIIEAITEPDREVYAQGILAFQSETNFNGNATIVVNGGLSGRNGATYGVDAQCDPGNPYVTTVNFNGALTKVQVTATGEAYGLRPSGAPGTIRAKGTAEIDVSSTEGLAYGVHAIYGAMADFENDVKLSVSAPNGAAIALSANTYKNYVGSINVSGSVTATIDGKEATGVLVNDVSTSSSVDDGLITIGGSVDLQVTGTEVATAFSSVGTLSNIQVKGDIDAQVGSNAGNVVGLTVSDGGTLTLSGAENHFALNTTTGVAKGVEVKGASALTLSGSTVMTGATVGITTEVDSALNLSEGASLSVDGEAASEGVVTLGQGALLEVANDDTTASTFATVNAEDATLAFGSGTYLVNSLTGDGNHVRLTDLANTDTVTIATRTSGLTFEATGASNDMYANAQATADALVGVINVTDTTAEKDQIVVYEGAVNDGLIADFDATTGEISNEVVTKNSSVDALGSMATLTFLQWRHELSSIEDRMGDLRSGAGTLGGWARLYGSEMSYGAQSLTAKNTSVEIGADLPIGNAWTVGATFSYTNGSAEYDAGEADNNAYGLGAYALWSSGTGFYADVAFKYHRLSTDLKVRGVDGEKDNNAFGLTGELGWHLPFATGAYVEPMVTLAYGRIAGEDYSLGNGVRIEEDDTNSLTAGVGLRTGFSLPDDRGSIYAKVKLLHDFDGEVAATTTLGDAHNTYREELGDTFAEFGVGASFNLSNSTNAFVSLARSIESNVEEKWRWNVGLRHAF